MFNTINCPFTKNLCALYRFFCFYVVSAYLFDAPLGLVFGEGSIKVFAFGVPYVRSDKRIGPHNFCFYELLYGITMGDGYLEKYGEGVRLQFLQSVVHKAFFESIAQKLYSWGYTNKAEYSLNVVVVGQTCHYNYSLKTFYFTSLAPFYDLLYVKDKKVILPSHYPFITPQSLAYLCDCDGSNHGQGVRISTNAFSEESLTVLNKILLEKFDVQGNFHTHRTNKDGTKQYRLSFNYDNGPKLIGLIKPYTHPSMAYKYRGQGLMSNTDVLLMQTNNNSAKQAIINYWESLAKEYNLTHTAEYKKAYNFFKSSGFTASHPYAHVKDLHDLCKQKKRLNRE